MPRGSVASHPERPFSPSPPRDNRHSASRPPSLLFGAPPVSTVAASNAFGLAELPATPPRSSTSIPRSSSNDHLDDFPSLDHGTASHRRYQSDPFTTDTTSHEGRPSRGRPIETRSTHKRSDSESSTTSSSSPPLGATSILSAIATSTPAKGQPVLDHSYRLPSGTKPSAYGSFIHSPAVVVPGSPQSFQSGFSSSSSTMDGLSPHKSLPRLHQPTVVRSKSGKGLAFLPSSAQVFSRSTAVQHQSPSHPPQTVSRSQADSRPASIVSLEHIQHYVNRLELGPPIVDLIPAPREERLITMKGAEENSAVQPTSYRDIPLPPSPDDDASLHEAQPSPSPAPVIPADDGDQDLGDSFKNPVTSSEHIEPISLSAQDTPRTAKDLFIPINEIATPLEETVPVISTSDVEHQASETSSTQSLVVPVISRSENTHYLASHNSDTSQDSGDTQNPSDVRDINAFQDENGTQESNDHSQGNEIDSDLANSRARSDSVEADLSGLAISKPTSSPSTTHFPGSSPAIADDHGSSSLPVKSSRPLPYKARDGSRIYGTRQISEADTSREITICASLNHPANPVPQLTAYRVELALSWGHPQILRWLPGRTYIPNWDLKIVGHSQNPVIVDIRVLVKTVITKIPILWRFASWL